MKKIILFALISFASVTLFAQVPLSNGGGPGITNFKNSISTCSFLSDDGDSFNIYISPKIRDKKYSQQGILTYDKSSNTVTTQVVNVPEKYKLFAKDLGDSYFVGLASFPKKTLYEFHTAIIPKQSGETNITPEKQLAIEMTTFGDVIDRAAQSPDGKQTAALFIRLDRKGSANKFQLFTYDEKGNEVINTNFEPEIFGGTFSFEDFQISNEGKVYILLRSGKGNTNGFMNTAVQLLTCDKNGFKSYGKPYTEGMIQSMKMVQQKNGNVLIGGYAGKKDGFETSSHFCVIFDQNDLQDIQYKTLPEDQQTTKKSSVGMAFGLYIPSIHCNKIVELENGQVCMIGEEHICIKVIDQQNGQVSYNSYLRNINVQRMNEQGKNLDSEKILKRQVWGFKNMLHYGDVFNYSFNFEDFGLSLSPIVKGNDLYLLYTDNQKNIAEPGKADANLNPALRNKTCLVLHKVGGDKEIALLPGKDKVVFHKLWYFDGTNAYVGMFNNKSYSIEHFEVK